MEELRRALAALYRMKGRPSFTEKELVFLASMDLRWFSPKEAQRMMEAGLRTGLLTQAGSNVSIAFDPQGVDLPVNFKPDPTRFPKEETAPDFLAEVLKLVLAHTKKDKRTVMARVNELRGDLLCDIEAAALVVALESGVEVRSLAEKYQLGLLEGRAAHSSSGPSRKRDQ